MVFNLGIGRPKRQTPPVFTITVGGSSAVENTDYRYAQEKQADGTVNWELALLTSCTVNFQRVVPVDLFLVGGGKPGDTGTKYADNDVKGGSGGAGGTRVQQDAVTLTEGADYAVTIGGSNGSTSGFGCTASSGGGSGGGSGGHVSGNSVVNQATGGSGGAFAFGEASSLIEALSGRKYGPGGGGAACRNYWNGTYYYAANGTYTGGDAGNNQRAGDGGSNPDDSSARNGGSGGANTGAGGGGACRGHDVTGTAGAGGSGILILRNARGGNT